MLLNAVACSAPRQAVIVDENHAHKLTRPCTCEVWVPIDEAEGKLAWERAPWTMQAGAVCAQPWAVAK